MIDNNSSTQAQMQKYINELYEYQRKSKESAFPTLSLNVDNNLDQKVNAKDVRIDYKNKLTNSENGERLYNELKRQYLGKGYLQVQTMTLRKNYPVEDADVTILLLFDNNEKYIIAKEKTDNSGYTPLITLPAVPKEMSEIPNSNKPYISYTVVVEHPNFIPMIFYNIPVFEGIVSTQPAVLTLKTAMPDQDVIEVYEKESLDLN